MLWLLLLSSSKNKVFVCGSRTKHCTCEGCGHQFEYQIEREAGGKDNSLFSWDEKHAFRKAEADAQKNVEKMLDTQDDAVPCPNCGRVQAAMIEAVRRQSYRGLKEFFEFGLFATIVGVVLPAVLAIALQFARTPDAGGREGMPLTLMLVAGGIGVIGGLPTFGLWLLRHLLNSAYDPNAGRSSHRSPAKAG